MLSLRTESSALWSSPLVPICLTLGSSTPEGEHDVIGQSPFKR